MAYRKRYNTYGRKRRFSKRRNNTPWYNKKYSVSQMASRALRGVNYIRGLVNSEMFKYDTTASLAVTTSGNMDLINDMAQGDGDNTRTGNSIYIRQVDIRGELVMDTDATSTTVRLMLVCDTQQIGDTAPGVGDVLDSALNTFSVYRPLNSDTVGRFNVLYARNYILNPQRPSCLFRIFRKMRLHTRFNGIAATDIQRNGLYLLAISNEATNAPAVVYTCRVSYHDN